MLGNVFVWCRQRSTDNWRILPSLLGLASFDLLPTAVYLPFQTFTLFLGLPVGHSTHPWKNGEVVLYIAAPGSKKAVTKAQATEEVCPREGNHCQYADSLPATSTGSARMDRVRFWR